MELRSTTQPFTETSEEYSIMISYSTTRARWVSRATKLARNANGRIRLDSTTKWKKYTWTGKKLMYEKRFKEEEEQKEEENVD